jgi:hypothetical protein
MIKTTLIYFILDKCLDKLEQMVVYNLTEPEKRKLNFFDDNDIWFKIRIGNMGTYKIKITTP